MNFDEQLKKQYEEQQRLQAERLASDPEFKRNFERNQAAFLADPKVQALLKQAEDARTYRNLEPGCGEALALGCICVDVRDENCKIHGFTMRECFQAIQAIEDTQSQSEPLDE